MENLAKALNIVKKNLVQHRLIKTREALLAKIDEQVERSDLLTSMNILLERLDECPIEELTETMLIDINYAVSKI